MSILNRILKLFSVEKTDNQKQPASVQNQKVQEIDIASKLCTNNMKAEDDYVRSDSDNESEKDMDSIRKQIRTEHGIRRVDNVWYRIKDLFVSQDLESKLEKEFNLSKKATKEDYVNCAREYFKNVIGNTEGLSDKKIEKLYRKAEREFYLQLLNMNQDTVFTDEIFAAAIGELKADKRTQAVKDFISLGERDYNINNRASCAQKNAEYNLTNRDGFGKVPSKEDAIEYQRTTFANMSKIGVKVAIADLNNRTSELDIKYCKKLQQMKAKGDVLTPEQEDLLVKYENCVLGGYTGAYTGVASNEFISDSMRFVMEQLESINQATLSFNIQRDVLREVAEYVSNHPEAAESVVNNTGMAFEELINEVTGGAYNRYLAENTQSNTNPGSTAETESGNTNTENETELYAQNKVNEQENRNGNVTNPVTHENEAGYSGFGIVTNPQKTPRQSVSGKDNTDSDMPAQLETKPSCSSQNKQIAMKKAAKDGIKAFDKCVSKLGIGKIETCRFLLNSDELSAAFELKAKNVFSQNLNDSEKSLVFSSLKSCGQEKVAQFTDKETLGKIAKDFANYDAKVKIEKILDEKEA